MVESKNVAERLLGEAVMKQGQLYKSIRTGRYYQIVAHNPIGVAAIDLGIGRIVRLMHTAYAGQLILIGNNYRSLKP